MPAALRTVAAFHLAATTGPSRTLAPVLRRLAEAGDVVIAVPSLDEVPEETRALGRVVATGHVPLTLPRRPRDAWGLPSRLRRDAAAFRALLRQERPDLVLIATTTLPALALAARRHGVPAIVYATELYRQGRAGDALRARAGRAVVRLNARLATATVAASHTVAAQLPARAHAVVAHPSIDPALAEGDGDAFRAEHGLEAAAPLLATLGNLAPGRGQDVAIGALAELRARHPRAQLVVAGEPHPRPADRAYAASLRSLARRLGVDDAVRFCGFARPGDVFAACDVFLNPARFAETFGRAAMEALVASRPVVSTRVGAVPEVLEDERTALLVAPDDAPAMAAAVERLLGDHALAERIAAAGREYVLTTFTEERQLARFEQALVTALGERAPGMRATRAATEVPA